MSHESCCWHFSRYSLRCRCARTSTRRSSRRRCSTTSFETRHVADALRAIAACWSALRRFYLPWLASTAALAVIVTSPFSAKDMLLNLLAVAFITEADDMLAMLLSPAERRRPDKALEEMRKSGVVVDGMVFARLVALACSASIVLFVVYAESFVNALSWRVQRNGRRFNLYAVIAAFLSLFLHLLVHWVSLCATTTKCKAALLAWSDGFYNLAVLWFGASVLFAAVGIAIEDFWSVPGIGAFPYGVLAVVFGCISAALRACANRLAKKAPKERGVACAPEFE